MTTIEPIELLYARLDERLKVIEREMGAIRASQIANAAPAPRPSWPVIVAAIVACAALALNIASNL